MDITITINTDNAAFDGCGGDEVARLLHHLSEGFKGSTLEYSLYFHLKDTNGNAVGLCEGVGGRTESRAADSEVNSFGVGSADIAGA